uniref:Lactosylceramide alpha-2,3-sialyltransferase n=1 Tax=Astyanax mexicanus TaxID=7994 RepID=A0A3B1IKX2_ASTMX
MRNRGKDQDGRTERTDQSFTDRMRKPVSVCGVSVNRRFLIPLMVLGLISIVFLKVPLFNTNPKPVLIDVDPSHREFCDEARDIKHHSFPAPLYLYLLSLFISCNQIKLPSAAHHNHQFKLLIFTDIKTSGLEYTVYIFLIPRVRMLGNCFHGSLCSRLNSGPVRNFSRDVGNRTTFRMSYPEGTPKIWEDEDPELQFVAVIYKSVDFNWLHSVITGAGVSLWDKIFFWQKVPESIPVTPSKIRLLNPEIIRQTALDFLHYPKPKQRLWGWDQNIPTLGVSALNLATYLCDELSLAGFGYHLSQKDTPLHYYDNQPMTAMLKQGMHNVDQETAFLQRLVTEGGVSDLTGGIHCSFCSR